MTDFIGAPRGSTNSRSRNWLALLAATLLLVGIQSTASAQFSVDITVDEDGHARLTNTNGFDQALPFGLLNDPGPGGLSNILTYGLLNPPGLVAGDVFLRDGVGGLILDVLRFNANESCFGSIGCLLFYSDNVDGVDSLGDTPGPPGAFYTNTVTLIETGIEGGAQGANYTPTAGQPGFVAGAGGPVTYHFISDQAAAVPEPATLALLGLGLAGLGFGRRKK